MKELELLKQEVSDLAEKSKQLLSTLPDISETDKLRRNIQRGKLIAYEHVLSILNQKK